MSALQKRAQTVTFVTSTAGITQSNGLTRVHPFVLPLAAMDGVKSISLESDRRVQHALRPILPSLFLRINNRAFQRTSFTIRN